MPEGLDAAAGAYNPLEAIGVRFDGVLVAEDIGHQHKKKHYNHRRVLDDKARIGQLRVEMLDGFHQVEGRLLAEGLAEDELSCILQTHRGICRLEIRGILVGNQVNQLVLL